MGSMEDAFRKAGVAPAPPEPLPESACARCGKQFRPARPQHRMCDECATAMRSERAVQGPVPAGGAEKPAGERPAEAAAAATAPPGRERPFREPPPRRERPPGAAGTVAFVSASRELPHGYLQGGYFAPSGALRREVLTDWAEQVAQALAYMPSDSTAQQLRVFFNHVRRAWEAFKFGKRPIEPALNEIQKLKAFAVERSARRKAPEVFRRFIEANVDRVVDEKTLQAFVQHFQAVAAYAGGLLHIRKERR
ncbi:MAG: type III-A CRISPR-associated protein Csm2 [Acidobacteria bacterium]|nr:type III-A CRISPR-associated protein Csm2 [Acidobacteriota bacterium]